MSLSAPLIAAASPTPTLGDFEANLAAHDSATKALQNWCMAHQIGEPPIRAQQISASSNDPPAKMRRLLGLDDDDTFAMRNVRLLCGAKVLSVAWNWYVPSRLTPEMNAALQDTDTPFGKVAAALKFRRETLEVVRGQADNCPAGTISTHRAMLRLPDGRPLAYLLECYTGANLGR